MGSRAPEFYTSAQDVAVFAQMLLNRGIYAHHRYFRIETVDKFTGPRGAWLKPSESDWTGQVFSPKAFGHISESGSLLWIDPARNLFVVLMAAGKTGNKKIPDTQRHICESIVAAIQN